MPPPAEEATVAPGAVEPDADASAAPESTPSFAHVHRCRLCYNEYRAVQGRVSVGLLCLGSVPSKGLAAGAPEFQIPQKPHKYRPESSNIKMKIGVEGWRV